MVTSFSDKLREVQSRISIFGFDLYRQAKRLLSLARAQHAVDGGRTTRRPSDA